MFPHKEKLVVALSNAYCCPLNVTKTLWDSSLLRHLICVVVLTANSVVLQGSPIHRNVKYASETALQVEKTGLAFN